MFGGKYEADCPPISMKRGEKGELLLEFVEGHVVTGSRPDGSTLRDSSITISDTVVGENIKYVQSSYSEYVLTSYFGGYSLGNDAGKFIVNKAKGMVKINQQSVKNLSNRMKQIPGKEWLGEAIGYIPFVGTAVKFGVDTIKNKNEAERNVKFVEDEMGNVNVAMVYSDFDCCVNFVDYDLAEKSSHEFYPYKGEQTESKIVKFNEEGALVEAFSTELNDEIILRNPEEVVEFWQRIQSDEDLKIIIDEIPANKR